MSSNGNSRIKKVVIVGGGTSGWITAGLLAVEHQANQSETIEVVLVESPNVSPIGVGEGTWPTMRNTLSKLGVSETEFLRHCDASFKQASQFIGWVDGQDSYYHPFTLPAQYLDTNLAAFWPEFKHKITFSDAFTAQSVICDRGLAPKQIATPEYAAVLNYGYHLDSFKFSEFLKQHAIDKLGVTHISDDVVGVLPEEDGSIRAVSTKNNGALEGDLFVDCTGFASKLIGEHFESPLTDVKQVLFADTALAVQVPYGSPSDPIVSHTLSTAQSAGWIWDIGLPSRRGTGYVYSSAHISDSDAEAELAEYVSKLGSSLSDLHARKIPINSGYRKTPWVKNCIAVGLSAGFAEPLEASSLVLVELAAKFISEELPATKAGLGPAARKYNALYEYRWERIVDFLKLHYVLSKREDSEFWKDNRSLSTIPDSLQDFMEIWKYRSPWHDDFAHRDEIFSAASYQYVLYGMGFDPQLPLYKKTDQKIAMLLHSIKEVSATTGKMVAGLPTNRELLEKVKTFGLQKI